MSFTTYKINYCFMKYKFTKRRQPHRILIYCSVALFNRGAGEKCFLKCVNSWRVRMGVRASTNQLSIVLFSIYQMKSRTRGHTHKHTSDLEAESAAWWSQCIFACIELEANLSETSNSINKLNWTELPLNFI